MLTDLSKGDMQAAENLGDDDIEVSEDEAGEEDKMSLASDLDEEDLEEVEKRQMELEQKAGKKKLVNLSRFCPVPRVPVLCGQSVGFILT